MSERITPENAAALVAQSAKTRKIHLYTDGSAEVWTSKPDGSHAYTSSRFADWHEAVIHIGSSLASRGMDRGPLINAAVEHFGEGIFCTPERYGWLSSHDWFVSYRRGTVTAMDLSNGEEIEFHDFDKLKAWAGY